MSIKLLIGKRIAEGRAALGLSQLELSALTGFGKTRISNWETGFRTPKLEESKVLEKCLKIPAPYLLCLSEYKDFPHDFDKRKHAFKSIPLLSENELLKTEHSMQLDKLAAERYLPLICSNEVLAKQGGFAFELYDNSMSPEFNKGDIIALNPTAKVRHNDLVLVKVRESGEILFRKYFLDNTQATEPVIKLIPNNTHWVTLTTQNPSDWLILGVLSNLQRLFT